MEPKLAKAGSHDLELDSYDRFGSIERVAPDVLPDTDDPLQLLGLVVDPTLDSVEEVAKWSRQSVRTSYREQAAFREAFPKLDTPAQIFADPAVRSRVATVAKASDAVEKAITDVKKDLKIMEFAMMPANPRDL